MANELTVSQLRAIATAFNRIADAAEAAGQNTADLTAASFNDLDTTADQVQAALDAAKNAPGS